MTKYLKVMADYSSTGLWDKKGIMVDVEELNLSPSTVKALKEWCSLYDQNNDDYLDEKDRKQPLFDLKAFSNQGVTVARSIKEELPEYTIEYFDDYWLSTYPDGGDCLVEIK